MKNIFLFTLTILILSCGVKKDLAESQTQNNELELKLLELEKQNKVLNEKNAALISQVQSLKRSERYLRNEAIYLRNEKSRLTKQVKNLGGEIEEEIIMIKAEPNFPEPTKQIDPIFTVVEKMPEFPGGMEKMMQFITNKIRYPQEAKEANVEGKVYVQFVVNKNGSITDVKVIRGIGSGCDEEAMRVVQSMPKWNPGTQRGKPVNVRMLLPVSFRLN